MTYGCAEFVESIMDALGVDTGNKYADEPCEQADLALAEIERLQKLENDVRAALRSYGSGGSSPNGFIGRVLEIAAKSVKAVHTDEEEDETEDA